MKTKKYYSINRSSAASVAQRTQLSKVKVLIVKNNPCHIVELLTNIPKIEDIKLFLTDQLKDYLVLFGLIKLSNRSNNLVL